MRPGRGALILILALGASGCAREAPPLPAARPAAVLLAVVSWNMRAGTGDLTRLIDDLESGRLSGAAGPDYLLLLQEATADIDVRARTAAGSRSTSTFFVPVRRSPERTTGNAVVATLALAGQRVIDLPRERQPRAAAAATVEVAGEQLFVASAHLENRLGFFRGLFGDRARRRQAAALLAALPASGPGILGGDMNTMFGPNERAWRALLDRFDDTPRDRPQPTFRERLVLDHLFFDLPDGWHAATRVLTDRYGSDHHPVLGVVTR